MKLETLTVSLTKPQLDFINKQVADNNYKSVYEVILVSLGLFIDNENEGLPYFDEVAERAMKDYKSDSFLETITVSLDKPLFDFIVDQVEQVEDEHYASVSEVIAVAVGLFMEYEGQRLAYVAKLQEIARKAQLDFANKKKGSGREFMRKLSECRSKND